MSALRHVAIIPDGNRRWARSQGLKTFDGHNRGFEAFEKVAEHAADVGVEYLTGWGLSVDNFKKRSLVEVAGLTRIFKEMFVRLSNSDVVHEKEIRIRALGQWSEMFPEDTKQAVMKALDVTSSYSKFNLTLLLGYNGTDDMLQAIEKVLKMGRDDKSLMFDEQVLKSNLATFELPAVDLVIRTGGDPHLSNGFMMWETANAELYFTETLWPDFSSNEFDKALDVFGDRRRMMGT